MKSKKHIDLLPTLAAVFITAAIVCSCRHTQPIVPLCKNDLYAYTFGSNTLTVSAKTGGRILSFTCNGEEFLLPSDVHNVNYGATLWPSPQRNWGWPPYPVLDTEPYEAELNKGVLKLTSKPDPASGFRFEKEFSICLEDSSVQIVYTIRNISDRPLQVSAWEVCRSYGGISFFPVGEDAVLPDSKLKNTSVSEGICWYEFNKDSVPTPQKLFSTAKEGWLAHTSGESLFIKVFPDTDTTELAPEQGEVEIFCQKDGLYIELENHGKYTTLNPEESLTYPVRWYLRHIPEIRTMNHTQLSARVRNIIKNN